MSAWRLDEVQAEGDGGLIADLDVVPGDPHTRRRIARLEQAVAERPEIWQNRVALAQSLVQDGQFDRAAQQLRCGLDLVAEPQLLSALFFNLGVCEENLERWEQAASAYEQCVFLMPRLFWAHHGLGVSLHRLGNTAGAIISLRRALALDPEVEEGHRSLAEVYRDAGLLREAEGECRWLIELDPDNVWAARTLAELKAQLN
jgi:tetratricopeptide (TPR) repeat protein